MRTRAQCCRTRPSDGVHGGAGRVARVPSPPASRPRPRPRAAAPRACPQLGRQLVRPAGDRRHHQGGRWVWPADGQYAARRQPGRRRRADAGQVRRQPHVRPHDHQLGARRPVLGPREQRAARQRQRHHRVHTRRPPRLRERADDQRMGRAYWQPRLRVLHHAADQVVRARRPGVARRAVGTRPLRPRRALTHARIRPLPDAVRSAGARTTRASWALGTCWTGARASARWETACPSPPRGARRWRWRLDSNTPARAAPTTHSSAGVTLTRVPLAPATWTIVQTRLHPRAPAWARASRRARWRLVRATPALCSQTAISNGACAPRALLPCPAARPRRVRVQAATARARALRGGTGTRAERPRAAPLLPTRLSPRAAGALPTTARTVPATATTVATMPARWATRSSRSSWVRGAPCSRSPSAGSTAAPSSTMAASSGANAVHAAAGRAVRPC